MRFTLALLIPAVIATGTGNTYDDNYDDLGQSIAVGLPQITKYNGLTYKGWALGTASAITGSSGGLIPHSKRNTAVAVTTLTALTGNPGIITAGDGVKCFDVSSFYYGCVLNAGQGQLGAAAGCGITFSGYSVNSKKMVGALALNYDVGPNILASPMRLADISQKSEYKCLKNVTIAISTGLDAIVLIDNFIHTNYKS